MRKKAAPKPAPKPAPPLVPEYMNVDVRSLSFLPTGAGEYFVFAITEGGRVFQARCRLNPELNLIVSTTQWIAFDVKESVTSA